MSYITPALLAEAPGALELAEVSSSDHGAIVDAELMELTLRGGSRTQYSAEQIAIADEALARINQLIVETDEYVDGYLARRYTLPLAAPVPKVLTVWARAIVRYRLHKNLRDDDRSNPIVRDYRDAVKFLEQVADGKFSLGVADPGAQGKTLGDVQIESNERVFNRAQMDSFR
jgi:phage gp36-like protein